MIDGQEIGVHPEVVAWTLAQLNDEERREFCAELAPVLREMLRLHPETDTDRLVELGRTIAWQFESWRLSMCMIGDPDWQEQVTASRKAWRAGERETSTVDDLRNALAV